MVLVVVLGRGGAREKWANEGAKTKQPHHRRQKCGSEALIRLEIITGRSTKCQLSNPFSSSPTTIRPSPSIV